MPRAALLRCRAGARAAPTGRAGRICAGSRTRACLPHTHSLLPVPWRAARVPCPCPVSFVCSVCARLPPRAALPECALTCGVRPSVCHVCARLGALLPPARVRALPHTHLLASCAPTCGTHPSCGVRSAAVGPRRVWHAITWTRLLAACAPLPEDRLDRRLLASRVA
eukprot:3188275-Prymnesium_polylepis.2